MKTETPRERLARIKATTLQLAEELNELSGDLTDFNYEYDGTVRGEKIDNAADTIYEFANELENAIESLKLLKPSIDREFNDSTEYEV